MDSLLDSSQDAMQIAADDKDGGNHKADYTGYVLALNGHKKYFCLFKPVYTGEDLDSQTSEDEGTTAGGRSKSGSREEHPTRKSSRSRSISTLQIHHKLDRLGLWMERLLEGTLPRYYISAWPEMDTIAPAKWREACRKRTCCSHTDGCCAASVQQIIHQMLWNHRMLFYSHNHTGHLTSWPTVVVTHSESSRIDSFAFSMNTVNRDAVINCKCFFKCISTFLSLKCWLTCAIKMFWNDHAVSAGLKECLSCFCFFNVF